MSVRMKDALQTLLLKYSYQITPKATLIHIDEPKSVKIPPTQTYTILYCMAPHACFLFWLMLPSYNEKGTK